jgi:hypothetical protein
MSFFIRRGGLGRLKRKRRARLLNWVHTQRDGRLHRIRVFVRGMAKNRVQDNLRLCSKIIAIFQANLRAHQYHRWYCNKTSLHHSPPFSIIGIIWVWNISARA